MKTPISHLQLPKPTAQRLSKGVYLIEYIFNDITHTQKIKAGSVRKAEQAARRQQKMLMEQGRQAVGADVSTKEHAQIVGSITLKQAFLIMEKTIWADVKDLKGLTLNADIIMRELGYDKPIKEINTGDLNRLVQKWRLEGKASSTINRKLSALSVMLRAAAHGKLTGLPLIDSVPFIPKLKEAEGRIRVITKEEQQQVESVLDEMPASQSDIVDLLRLLMDTGCRPSELGNSQISDYNAPSLVNEQGEFGVAVLHIWKNKTNKPRSIPLTGRAKAIVESRIQRARGQGITQLFPNHSRDRLRHVWDKVRVALDLVEDKEFVPYAFRHTVATRLLEGGASIYQVKEWLGHTTVTTTERYTHMHPSNLNSLTGILE